MTVAVVSDSACDLSPSLADDRGVLIVPLKIRFGDEELADREELSTKEFWDRVTTGNVIPETAAPSPGQFEKAFSQAASDGAEGVVCVVLSSGVSATYQSACNAATAVADDIRVEVVDSQSMTLGQGLMVLSALDMARAGTTLDEIVSELGGLKKRTHAFGAIESLDFLKRGGRIGGAQHLFGSLLSIKPVIEIRNGVVEVESKQRTRQRSLQYLASKATEAGPLERLGVANGAAADIEEVLSILGATSPVHETVVCDLGPVVGSHAGPGTIAICYQTAAE